MTIRNATLHDLDTISRVESLCFPANEAASRSSFAKRLQRFSPHFWLLEDKLNLIGFVNGMVTDNETITDAMFQNADLHKEDGKWQSVFGLAIAPDYQKQGHAQRLIKHLIEVSKQQNRQGVILTCKESLIPFYEKLGFSNAGLSNSVHGGEVWFDMRIDFHDLSR
ncbi:GNAT family N-acetyltransferase [Spirosoma aerophilum]